MLESKSWNHSNIKPPENILPKRSYKGGLLPKEVLPEELSDAEEASDTSDDPVEEPKE